MSIAKKHFEKINNTWKCKLCPENSPTYYKVNSSGTTTTRRVHLKKIHGITDSVSQSSPKTVKLAFFRQPDKLQDFHNNIVVFFAEHGIPYQVIESPSFRDMLRTSGKYVKVSYYDSIINQFPILDSIKA